jgi:hypothetical protein
MILVQHRGRSSTAVIPVNTLVIPANSLVIPAKAGTRGCTTKPWLLGPRFRGDNKGWRP